MKGKFVVLDGIDGSGKGTQTEILRDKLLSAGYKVEVFDFPQYGKKSASLVEEYLNGQFGTAEEVGPYKGSVFYAVDRFAASKKMREFLDEGYVIISNRYVSANKGHQTSKIKVKGERQKFIEWLNEFEYGLFGIPIPDITIFLHVPSEIGYKLVLKKASRDYIKGKKQDIHEADKNHLRMAELAYLEMTNGADEVENWVKISCHENEEILSVEEVSNRILDVLIENKIINKGLLTERVSNG